MEQTNSRDWLVKDWEECRATMGRLDGVLVDLRKYGFGLITALAGGGALVVSDKVQAASADLITPTLAAFSLLTVVVFFLDSYFQILLNSASERGMDLEAQLAEKHELIFGTTTYLCYDARRTGAVYIALVLYLALLAIEALFAKSLATTEHQPVYSYSLIAAGLILAYFVYTQWCFNWGQKPNPRKARDLAGAPAHKPGSNLGRRDRLLLHFVNRPAAWKSAVAHFDKCWPMDANELAVLDDCLAAILSIRNSLAARE